MSDEDVTQMLVTVCMCESGLWNLENDVTNGQQTVGQPIR